MISNGSLSKFLGQQDVFVLVFDIRLVESVLDKVGGCGASERGHFIVALSHLQLFLDGARGRDAIVYMQIT